MRPPRAGPRPSARRRARPGRSERACGPSRAQFSTVARTSGTRTSRSAPASSASRSAAASSVTRKLDAIEAAAWYAARSPSASSNGRISSASASPRARSSARGVLPEIAAPAPAKRAAPSSAVNVISGCSEKRSCGASTSRPVAPEQWPTDTARGDQRPRRRRSRHRERTAGRRRTRPRRRRGRADQRLRPRRSRRARTSGVADPATTDDGDARQRSLLGRLSRDAQGRGVQRPFQFPHQRYRSENEKLANCVLRSAPSR